MAAQMIATCFSTASGANCGCLRISESFSPRVSWSRVALSRSDAERLRKTASDQAAKADERLSKLVAVNFAITAFLIVVFISADASLSLFGISLKNVAGVREILLGITGIIVILVAVLSTSRDILIFTVEKVLELRSGPQFKSFTDLAAPSAMGIKFYVGRQFDRWLFPTRFTRLITFFMTILLFALFISTF